jgi:hypothetical protein
MSCCCEAVMGDSGWVVRKCIGEPLVQVINQSAITVVRGAH